MQFAIVGNNKHQRPETGLKGKCPFCGEDLIAKCGNIKVHHWSHSSKSECPYKKNKGPWHINWQNNFPDDWQEYLMYSETGEKNIADIRTPSGFVIEFQHSHIKDEELYQRENFYKNMTWVVNAANWKKIFLFFKDRFEDHIIKDDYKSLKKIDDNKLDAFFSKGEPTNIKKWEIISSFILDTYEYEAKFSEIWSNSHVPVFYDLYGEESSEERKIWQQYLYCCFPYRRLVGFYFMPIKREEFIEIANHDKLNDWLDIMKQNVDNLEKKEIERIKEEDLQIKKQIEKEKKIEKFMDFCFNALKSKSYFPINNNVCNIIYNCCPQNGTTLNKYWHNISKDKEFFTGNIENGGKIVGFPIAVFVNKNNKSITVLCKNFINGIEQNSFSFIQIININGNYYHYPCFIKKNIMRFLEVIDSISFSTIDVKFL